MKKLLALLLALVMVLCAVPAMAEEEPVTLTWMLPAFDVNLSDDLLVVKELCERLNINIEFTNIAQDDFQTKFNTMLTDLKNMPDLVSVSKNDLDLYGPDVFVNLSEHKDALPHYFAIVEETATLDRVAHSDGNVYGASRYTDQGDFWYGLFMRKDVLEDAGIAIPYTLDEFNAMCAKLKELYPESYIQTGRWGLDNTVSFWAYWFSTRNGMYYEDALDKFVYGPATAEYKAMVEQLAMMWEKGYLDPEILTQSDEQFYTKLYNGVAFGMSDYFGADTNCNVYANEFDPEYYMCAIPIPEYNGVRGNTMVNSLVINGEMLAISQNCKNLDAALKLIDYLYSEEGQILTNWGVEGETYVVGEDGSYQYSEKVTTGANPNGEKTPREFGLYIGHFTKFFQYAVDRAGWSGAQLEGKTLYAELKVGEPEAPVLNLTEEQKIARDDINAELGTFRAETITAFITGERSLDEYDSYYLATIQPMVEELEAIYAEAYAAK